MQFILRTNPVFPAAILILLSGVFGSPATVIADDNPVAQRLNDNGTPTTHRHASTYAEGIHRGWADVIRAHGDYNYNTSLAAINHQEARRRAIENDIQYVQTYFKKQRLNRSLRKPGPGELTQSQINRAFNVVHWPVVLRDEALKSERQAIETLLAARNRHNSGRESANYKEAREVLDAMNAKLVASAKELGVRKYFTARRFLGGLELEFEKVVVRSAKSIQSRSEINLLRPRGLHDSVFDAYLDEVGPLILDPNGAARSASVVGKMEQELERLKFTKDSAEIRESENFLNSLRQKDYAPGTNHFVIEGPSSRHGLR